MVTGVLRLPLAQIVGQTWHPRQDHSRPGAQKTSLAGVPGGLTEKPIRSAASNDKIRHMTKIWNAGWAMKELGWA
jgi:hypothetical protein